MATKTSDKLRSQSIYSIFVRNYSEAGNFAAVTQDLPRIKKMGFNIVWFLPIYPIGKIQRKGKLGSPYAIRDYRKINPEYGSLKDFQTLVEQAHALGLKVIIDIVYNHTSPDSVLANTHPEWFYHDGKGNFGNRVADWSDVVDLDYSQKGLWQYQIDTLLQWAEIVDGFRCDVATLVPIGFWIEARRQVNSKLPETIWLAESAGRGFIQDLRSRSLTGLSDSELYQAFDITYDYDVFDDYKDFLHGKILLSDLVRELKIQDASFPANYVKLRFLENHDNPRAAELVPGVSDLINNLTWTYLQKGIPLIYAGQEYTAIHQPSLFDKDVIVNDHHIDLTTVLTRLNRLKQKEIFQSNNYQLNILNDGIVQIRYLAGDQRLTAWIPLRSQSVNVDTSLSDGKYVNLFSNKSLSVIRGAMRCTGKPIIIMQNLRK